MAASTRRAFAHTLMGRLGVRDNLAHVGTRRFLAGTWPHAETGEKPGTCTGNPGEGARWNPFNTTLVLEGSTLYNELSPGFGVRNYATAADGAEAFLRTLEGDHRYAEFLALLRTRYVTQRQLADALDKTPWGTHQPLLEEARSAYMSNRAHYNRYPIGA